MEVPVVASVHRILDSRCSSKVHEMTKLATPSGGCKNTENILKSIENFSILTWIDTPSTDTLHN
jgi:hypothetical protein